jgi:hypothetical protein
MSPRGQLARGIALAGVLAVALSAAPVTDGGRKAPPTLARPEALVAFTDPGFGTRVQRITGDPGTAIDGLAGQRWGAVVRHFYSKYSAWNADETLLILQNREPDDGGERLFLDGQTYRPRFSRVAPGDVRWDPLRPDWMAYLDGDEFGWWHVRDDRRERVARFPGYRRLSFGLGEGNLSWNGRWCVIVARNAAGRQVAFAFDARTQKKFPDLDLEDVRLDWASISPLGNYLVVDADAFTALEDNAQVYDREGRKVGALWAEYGRPSHYDLTVDENGDEVAVGVSKSRPDNGRVIKRRLRDGAITVLTAAGYASHTSTRNIRRPGWAFVTYQTNDARWAPYLNEVTAVSLDGSLRVERWAHLHTFPQGYLTEAHAVPSPDGGACCGRAIGTTPRAARSVPTSPTRAPSSRRTS